MANKPIAAGKSSFDLIDKDAFLASLPIKEDIIFLDAGCGEGNYTIFLAPHIQKGLIYAIDLWEEGIRKLEERVRQNQLNNVRPILCDLSKKLPIEDHSIDLCLMATVLHDLVQDGTHDGAIREIKRVLKPRGFFSVVEFKKMDGPPGPPRDIRLAPQELVDLLAPYGFELQGENTSIGAYHYMTHFEIRP